MDMVNSLGSANTYEQEECKLKCYMNNFFEKLNAILQLSTSNIGEELKEEEVHLQNNIAQGKQLESKIEYLLKETEVKKKEFAKRPLALQELRRELQESQKSLEQLLKERERLLNALKASGEEVKQLEEGILTQQKVTVEKEQALEHALSFFGTNLGLQFKMTKGKKIQVIYTSIDGKHSDQPFFFFLKVEESGVYTVTDCCPEIDGFEALIEKLNKTNSLTSFLIAVRRKFQEYVKTQR